RGLPAAARRVRATAAARSAATDGTAAARHVGAARGAAGLVLLPADKEPLSPRHKLCGRLAGDPDHPARRLPRARPARGASRAAAAGAAATAADTRLRDGAAGFPARAARG